MIYRIEKKYRIEKSNKINFYNWLRKKNFKEIFNKRIVNSIYYDNINLQMYDNSIEGIVPRKKIRIRYYNDKKNYFKEEKLSTINGEFKKSISLNINKPLKNIIDKTYGICQKVLNISYKRKYFLKNNIRITFDENIIYQNLNNNLKYEENNNLNQCVIEFKCSNNKEFLKIKDEIPFDEIRFSKYTNAIEYLKRNSFLTLQETF